MSRGDDRAATKAILANLQDLMERPPPGINAGPADDDLYEWTGSIQGPTASPYEGGLFFLAIRFNENYPFDPPHVRFTTPILHPNVNEKGDICLSILYKDCSWDQGWSPALSIEKVLLSIVILLTEPNTDHALRPELARLYDADRAAYDQQVREATKEHAM